MLRGYKHFILIVAAVALVCSLCAQDNTASYHTLISTNAVAKPTPELSSTPHAVVGTNMLVTGLLVDLAKPKQTWAMMNPTNAIRTVSEARPAASLRNSALFNGNLAVHEPDFAVVSFHFMHSSKPAVSTPKESSAQSGDK